MHRSLKPSHYQPVWFGLNRHGQVEANINLTAKRPEETSNGNLVIHSAPLENNIIQEQQQPQHTHPSPPIKFGMAAQLKAPNTARRLFQAAIRFDGLQFDDQLMRRSSMRGQLNLVSPSQSPPLIARAKDPLIPNQSQAHMYAPAILPPMFDPIALQLKQHCTGPIQ